MSGALLVSQTNTIGCLLAMSSIVVYFLWTLCRLCMCLFQKGNDRRSCKNARVQDLSFCGEAAALICGIFVLTVGLLYFILGMTYQQMQIPETVVWFILLLRDISVAVFDII